MKMGEKNIPVLLNLVNDCTNIITDAGRIVRSILKTGNLDIVDKGKNDLQTRADRAVQHFIVDSIEQKYPKTAIIGEEGNIKTNEEFSKLIKKHSDDGEKYDAFKADIFGLSGDNVKNITEDKIVIWVDPLDGTAEFTQGLLSHVTILIGIAVDGSPVAGIIHQPWFTESRGRTMWGIPGEGYGGFKVAPPELNKKVITTTRSHSNPQVEAAIAAIQPDEVLRVGGAGHKFLLVLEGKAHAYVFASKGCKKWDTCAPEALLIAAGGTSTNLKGDKYKYYKNVEHLNTQGLLATAPGQDYNWYLNTIKPVVNL